MSGSRALALLVLGILVVAVVGGAILLFGKGKAPEGGTGAEMHVYFISVDQGDAILIQTPDGKNIMVDSGYDDYAEAVIDFLKALGVGKIDAFIATHPDPDHIGAVPALFNEFEVRSVYHSGYVKTTQTYIDFMDAIEAEGCPVYDDGDIDIGDELPLSTSVTFQVLAIDSLAEDSNDASIVLKVTYGGFDLLLEGDASWSTEANMIEQWGDDLDVDVLKVSHHGSGSATSYDWLEATTPEAGIVTIGPNEWGLPDQNIIDRLIDHGVELHITGDDGSIALVTNGSTYSLIDHAV